MKRKEIAALILIGALLSGLITAGASEAGSASNPLISLSWLQETFLPGVKEDLENKIDKDLDQAVEGLLNAGIEGTEMRVKRGDVLTLESGSSLTPLAGDLSVASSGTVLDITDGRELPVSGGSLTTDHRYLTAEETQALFTITSDTAVVRLTGYYQISPSREPDYNELADALHDMGLFQGSNTPYGSGYDLEDAPTRIQGLIMFLRLLGEEDAALGYTDTSVTFLDVSGWARPYVAYAYEKGYTTGQKVSDEGEVTFGQDNIMAPRDYMTFLLRAMGYTDGADFKWKTALDDAQSLGLLTGGEVSLLTEKPFLRAQVVYLSYFALSEKTAGGSRLMEQLTSSGKITAETISEIIKGVSVQRL